MVLMLLCGLVGTALGGDLAVGSTGAPAATTQLTLRASVLPSVRLSEHSTTEPVVRTAGEARLSLDGRALGQQVVIWTQDGAELIDYVEEDRARY